MRKTRARSSIRSSARSSPVASARANDFAARSNRPALAWRTPSARARRPRANAFRSWLLMLGLALISGRRLIVGVGGILLRGMVALELDEVAHLVLLHRVERPELPHQLYVLRSESVLRHLVEELADGDVELREDLEQGIETDPVLALLHTGEVGLLDADTRGELVLRELALLAQSPDFSSDELDLTYWTPRGGHEAYPPRRLDGPRFR